MGDFKILLFASAREAAGGKDFVCVPMDEEKCSIESIMNKVFLDYPALEKARESSMIAVNLEYCEDKHKIVSEKDEIAIIPPVSGG